ncbi:FHA domain-containing protein [Nocardioides ultimimeridianus]
MTEPAVNDAPASLWSYRPGSWYAVFGPQVAVVLPAAQKEYVASLWSLVDGGSGFDEVLDALLASGLSRLPGFALVSTGAGPTRVLLRGVGTSATATSADGEVVLDGAAGGTWVERSIDGITSLTVQVEDAADADGGEQADLAIPAGLVRVARIDRPAVVPVTGSHVAAPVAAVPDAIDAPPFDVPAAQGAAEAPAPLEPSPLDNERWTEPTFAGEPLPPGVVDPRTEEPAADDAEQPADNADTPDTDSDTPADTEQPAEPAPAGWVTPWGQPEAPAAPAAPATPEVVAPVPGFAPPPPPPSGGAPSLAPPPPLPIGSWEAASPSPVAADTSGPVAKLVVSDGQTVLVDGVVLIGRAPEARRFTSTEQPQLITVPSRLHEISSTHIEIRPGTGTDQGSAVVTDMGSTNGTVLVQPGVGPEDLKPGIAVALVPGAIINLGDGVTIQVTRP